MNLLHGLCSFLLIILPGQLTETDFLVKKIGSIHENKIRRREVLETDRQVPGANGSLETSDRTALERSTYYAPRVRPGRRLPQRYNRDNFCPSDNVRLLINGMDCPTAIDHLGSFLCYEYERQFQSCCERCISLRDDRKQGCEYGDKTSQCRNMQPHFCYDRHNRDVCCETCPSLQRQLASSTPGCEYGNLTPRCNYIMRQLCYRNEFQRICCESCPRLRDPYDSECPYGDQNFYICRTLSRDSSRCYSPQTKQLCCSTCKRFWRNIPGCEYGDKHVSFTTLVGALDCEQYIRIYGREECENADVRSRCCLSCYGHRPTV